MSASAQWLLLPTKKCTSRNLYLVLTLAALFAALPRPMRYLGKALMKCQKEKEM